MCTITSTVFSEYVKLHFPKTLSLLGGLTCFLDSHNTGSSPNKIKNNTLKASKIYYVIWMPLLSFSLVKRVLWMQLEQSRDTWNRPFPAGNRSFWCHFALGPCFKSFKNIQKLLSFVARLFLGLQSKVSLIARIIFLITKLLCKVTIKGDRRCCSPLQLIAKMNFFLPAYLIFLPMKSSWCCFFFLTNAPLNVWHSETKKIIKSFPAGDRF